MNINSADIVRLSVEKMRRTQQHTVDKLECFGEDNQRRKAAFFFLTLEMRFKCNQNMEQPSHGEH